MKAISLLLLGAFFLSSCQDYVSSKREGLKPVKGADETIQAEESDESRSRD